MGNKKCILFKFIKQFVLVLFISTSVDLAGQSVSEGLFIPKDDGSPHTWPTKHMWVGKENSVAFVTLPEQKCSKIWVDNGKVDTIQHADHFIVIPEKPGPVNIFYILKSQNAQFQDSIQTKTSFLAITPPVIAIKIIKDDFFIDSTIAFILVDNTTQLPVDSRYVIGRMFEPKVFDSLGNYVGFVHHCFDTNISFKEALVQGLSAESVYAIKIYLWIRDLETDLLIPAEPLTYLIN
jgi:hypothetical protein